MKTVKVKLMKKVTYESIITVTDEEYNLIKDIRHQDIQEYDIRQAIKGDNGHYECPPNEKYLILEGVDSHYNEVSHEDTMFNVIVTVIQK